MKKFEVTVSSEFYLGIWSTVVVEAENEEEAEKDPKVKEAIEYVQDEIRGYVYDVEEEEEEEEFDDVDCSYVIEIEELED